MQSILFSNHFSPSLFLPHTGYLACTLLLNESSDLILLLINTIIKDLGSKNVLEINIALTAAIYLTPKDVGPMMIPILLDKTTHTKVRGQYQTPQNHYYYFTIYLKTSQKNI